MARLNAARRAPETFTTGEWVALEGDGVDGIEVLTIGFGDAYTDAKNAATRRAARAYHGDASEIPTAAQRRIVIDAMTTHAIRDVRGAENDDGTPANLEAFTAALLDQPANLALYIATVNAVALAGTRRAEETTAAAKN